MGDRPKEDVARSWSRLCRAAGKLCFESDFLLAKGRNREGKLYQSRKSKVRGRGGKNDNERDKRIRKWYSVSVRLGGCHLTVNESVLIPVRSEGCGDESNERRR